jgi:hypothetical protein
MNSNRRPTASETAALSKLSYARIKLMVVLGGIEPPHNRLMRAGLYRLATEQKNWQAEQDLNLRHFESKSNVLPTELPANKKLVEKFGLEPNAYCLQNSRSTW